MDVPESLDTGDRQKFLDSSELKRTHRRMENGLAFEELISRFSADLIRADHTSLKQELTQWAKELIDYITADRCIILQYYQRDTKARVYLNHVRPEYKHLQLPPESEHTAAMIRHLLSGKISLANKIPEDLPETFSRNLRQHVMAHGLKSYLALPLKTGSMPFGVLQFASYRHEGIWTEQLVRRLRLVAEMISMALVREKSDKELALHRELLEQLVEERTAELKEAQQDLIHAEKLTTLGQLTSSVAHELRNPLGTIRTSLYSINKRVVPKPDSSVHRAIQRAERSIVRCDTIIEELLAYSRMGSPVFAPVRIEPLIEDLLKNKPPPEGVLVKRNVYAKASIDLDRKGILLCLEALLDNAYHAIAEKGEKQGRVQIMAEILGNDFTIRIKDNGVGIEPGHCEKLLEPLYSTKSYGVGLGLSIADNIIKQHGGTLELDGEVGVGTEASLTLPLSDNSIRKSTPPAQNSSTSSGRVAAGY